MTGRIAEIKAELVEARKTERKAYEEWKKAWTIVDAADDAWSAASLCLDALEIKLDELKEESARKREKQP